MCWQTLPDGEYVLRVSGVLSDFSGDDTWQFCNTAGGSSEQLTFSIKHGVCTPIEQMSLSSMCGDSAADVVSILSGEIVIADIGADKTQGTVIDFTSAEETVIKNTLTYFIPTLTASDITITNYYGVDADIVVEFDIAISANNFGAERAFFSSQETVVSDVETALMEASQAETLTSQMLYFMSTANSKLFATMTTAHVSNLEMGTTSVVLNTDVVTTPDFVLDKTIHFESLETVQSTDYKSIVMTVGGFAAGGIALIALVVVVVRSNMKTDHKPQAVKTSDDIEFAAPQASKAPAALDQSMIQGLVKMVQDEDAALASAMSAGRFH